MNTNTHYPLYPSNLHRRWLALYLSVLSYHDSNIQYQQCDAVYHQNCVVKGTNITSGNLLLNLRKVLIKYIVLINSKKEDFTKYGENSQHLTDN